MLERIVAHLTERGCLLDPQAADYLARQQQPETYVDRVLGRLHEVPLVLTLDALLDADSPLVPTRPAPFEMHAPLQPPEAAEIRARQELVQRFRFPLPVEGSVLAPPPSAEVVGDVKILRDSSTSHPTSGDVRDFLHYINDRLESLTRLLKQRREVANAVPVKMAARAGRDIQLIGLVNEKSKRPSGHRFLTLEDASGEIDVMIPLDKPDLQAQFDGLLHDEVVGVVGRPARDGGLVVAEQILRPDIPYLGERVRPEGNLYAGFVSDVHVGSKTFLQREFRAMVRWLNGETGSERERQVARSVKYLVFPGDLVDGVGVYPGQQDALEILDVRAQYATFAKELENLPERLHIVLLPGNHDASRPNEPQPALSKELQALFDRHEKTFVSNPSLFSLHGVSVLGYHGHSMVDFATNVPGLRMDKPIPVMKHMLQCRHVAPHYGGKTPISPEERDHLVIDTVPDLFVTGHVHVAALDRYKGVTLVNGGTWQSQTDYQRMHNLVPTPARMPLVNLSTLTGTMIDFSGAE